MQDASKADHVKGHDDGQNQQDRRGVRPVHGGLPVGLGHTKGGARDRSGRPKKGQASRECRECRLLIEIIIQCQRPRDGKLEQDPVMYVCMYVW